MITIDGNILTALVGYIGGAFTAFMPVWGATVGVFLAFGVANMLRHFILRATIGKK